MNMAIVLEIILGVLLLAAAVRFAVRDVQQRRSDAPQQQSSLEHTPAEHHPSPVADQA